MARPHWRGRLSERPAADLGARPRRRSAGRSATTCRRCARACCRRRGRSRTDAVDRVPAGPRLPLRARRRHRRRAGRSPRSRSTRACRSTQIRHIALDTSSRTSVALISVLCRHHFRISPRFVPHGPDLAAMTRRLRCRAADRRSGVRSRSRGARAAEDRSGRGVDGDDRPAVRLRGVDRPSRRRGRRTTCAALQDGAGARASAAVDADCGRIRRAATPAQGRRAAAYLRDNVRYGLGADEAAGLQLFLDYAADSGWRPRRRAAGVLLTVSGGLSLRGLHGRADREEGDGRRPRRRGRGARAVSPRADAPARPPRRHHPRPQASGADRHLHHRPQRQLHEHLRRALQLLRVLPDRRLERRLRARLRGDLPEDRRDDRRRRQSAAAAGRPQSRPADPVVRGSVPRGQVALSGVQAARAVAAGSPAHLAAQPDPDAGR